MLSSTCSVLIIRCTPFTQITWGRGRNRTVACRIKVCKEPTLPQVPLVCDPRFTYQGI